VLKQTHIPGAVIVPFLLVAFALLYLLPAGTKSYFAWDVQRRPQDRSWHARAG